MSPIILFLMHKVSKELKWRIHFTMSITPHFHPLLNLAPSRRLLKSGNQSSTHPQDLRQKTKKQPHESTQALSHYEYDISQEWNEKEWNAITWRGLNGHCVALLHYADKLHVKTSLSNSFGNLTLCHCMQLKMEMKQEG